jgi:malonyl-CoA/methylmalonyl-CoA synthetase
MTGGTGTLFGRVAHGGPDIAIVSGGRTYSRDALDEASRRVASGLLTDRRDLDEARVAVFVPPGFAWVAAALGVWRAGGVVVPLALSHPPAELEAVIRDAGAAVVIADPPSAVTMAPLAIPAGARFVTTAQMLAARPGALPGVAADRRALIVYTSGTTGRPKGVVTSHAILAAQIAALVEAWGWTNRDRALLALPLHHVHGIVNVVGSALWAGATAELLPRFDAEEVWARLGSGDVTVFTAVPTIYHRLIEAWERATPEDRDAWAAGARSLRLMMSGSAPLPARVRDRWRQVTGHDLLERYGMTEIGMALSQPLHGERRPGSVGGPLPGVEIRIVDEAGDPVGPGVAGEVEIRGPGVFLEYWQRPDETRAAFRGGWFRTGDVARLDDGAYRLLGRASVDIIKTGGEKVSALEIEDTLRAHPAVADCAVVGVPDPAWGERVSVAAELRDGADLTIEQLRAWARAKLAPAKLPADLRVVPALPRNAMGKVVKPAVARLFDAP